MRLHLYRVADSRTLMSSFPSSFYATLTQRLRLINLHLLLLYLLHLHPYHPREEHLQKLMMLITQKWAELMMHSRPISYVAHSNIFPSKLNPSVCRYLLIFFPSGASSTLTFTFFLVHFLFLSFMIYPCERV